MSGRSWRRVPVLALLALSGGAVIAAVGVSIETSEEASSGGPPAAAGHELIATGGYHFTIPADFNGGIFGTLGPIENRLTFNAKRDADGTVSGWYTYQQSVDGSVFNFAGPVTCLQIYDTPVLERLEDIPPQVHNRAKWGGLIVQSNDPTVPPGRYIWFSSIDNGEGANGHSDVSTIPGIGDQAANEAFCNASRVPNSRFGPHRVGGGNIQVR